jgi:hypothetical protein
MPCYTPAPMYKHGKNSGKKSMIPINNNDFILDI